MNCHGESKNGHGKGNCCDNPKDDDSSTKALKKRNIKRIRTGRPYS